MRKTGNDRRDGIENVEALLKKWEACNSQVKKIANEMMLAAVFLDRQKKSFNGFPSALKSLSQSASILQRNSKLISDSIKKIKSIDDLK